ncbi:hypothetical protein IAT40_001980 [Kwoniella sp. CBS 6097]
MVESPQHSAVERNDQSGSVEKKRKAKYDPEHADFSLHLIDEDLVRAENEDKLTGFLCFLIGASALAGFLFGYDTAVVGVALPLVGTDLGHELTNSEQEITTAATTIGAIFGSAILGVMADKLGRKWCMFIADAFFLQTVAAAIGAGCQEVKHGWRVLFALGVIPSMVQLTLMHWLPESPRVLILRGKSEEARSVLQRIYSDALHAQIDFKLRVAEEYVEATTKLQREKTTWQRAKILWTTKAYQRSIISVSGVQAFGLLCGYNTLLYYAGTLFGLLGLSNPAVGALIPSGVNALFLLIGMSLVDKVGQRGLAVYGVPIIFAGYAWCIAAFYYLCKPTGGILDTEHVYDTKNVGVVISGIVLFVLGFGSTYAHLSWYQSEYLALEIRAAGSAIATTCNWVASLIVSVSYLSQLQTLTPAGTYSYYLCLVVVGYIFVIFCYPESNSYGIRKADAMRRQKQELLGKWAKEEQETSIHDQARKARETAHLEFSQQPTRGFREDMPKVEQIQGPGQAHSRQYYTLPNGL